MTDTAAEKTDNINSLCKKYFTPELCEEPVTETRRTLELKLYGQLERYAYKICRNACFACDSEDRIAVIASTIGECFANWKKEAPSSPYSVYFSRSIKNNMADENKRQERIKNTQSLNEPLPGGENGQTLEDILSKRSPGEDVPFEQGIIEEIDSKGAVEERFRYIDICFKAKRRSPWLKSMLTCVLYENLHDYYRSYPAERLEKWSFVDAAVYSLEERPTQKWLADSLGKDAGQMSTALKNFLAPIREKYGPEYERLKERE